MTLNARFPGTCAACGVRFEQGTLVEWTAGIGARHATNEQCKSAKAPAATAKLDLTPIAKFLQDAQHRGLKSPKLRVLSVDGKSELRLGLTRGGIAPGSISIVQEGAGFLGCIRPTGEAVGSLIANTALQQHLLQVAKDPVGAAKQYAALMCRCSFCGLELVDAGSVEAGYGPVCAKHWGLPHHAYGTSLLSAVPKVEAV